MDRTMPAGAARLFAFVHQAETTQARPGCYDVILGYCRSVPPKPLIKMTLDEGQSTHRYDPARNLRNGIRTARSCRLLTRYLLGGS